MLRRIWEIERRVFVPLLRVVLDQIVQWSACRVWQLKVKAETGCSPGCALFDQNQNMITHEAVQHGTGTIKIFDFGDLRSIADTQEKRAATLEHL